MKQLPKAITNVLEVYKHLSPKEKFFLYCAAIVIAGLVLDAAILRPFVRRLDVLSKETAELKTRTIGDLTLLRYGDRIQKQRADYSSYLTNVESDNEEFAVILKEVETVATKAVISILDIKPSGVKETDPVKKYVVNVSCEGTMEKLMEFMYSIETAPRLLFIEKYELTPKSKDTDLVKVTMSIGKLAFK
ncbi:MAG: type 4a pilus biogenesis protein PilO [Candidatus Omnitrophica bacterium]|nr:type 4a pilus biogenesis protein PilO [Candidatus Omnitrophota bacterium]